MNKAAPWIAAVCLCCTALVARTDSSRPAPTVILPKVGFESADIAIVINDADPLSVATGEYYAARRAIPRENIVRVRFDPTRATMSPAEFRKTQSEVAAKTPVHVQAFALAWMRPYRVGCMSITSAFAAGYDPRFCSEGCTATRYSPYFNSNSRQPFTEYGLRPAMLLAAADFERARELIDRGASSDGTLPRGKAYLVSTADANRNVRAETYADAVVLAGKDVAVERIGASQMKGKVDVMFYFVGATEVMDLGSHRFLPGAVADHLTSLGGDLSGTTQMSSLRWLEAGATGSYGTVTEPCNILGKFPNPGLMMKRYAAGETLVEAYWKSVAMPGQGVFIGEPLARPYGGYRALFDGKDLAIQAASLKPGFYAVSAANDAGGPYKTIVERLQIVSRGTSLRIRGADLAYYRITVTQ